MSTKKKPKKVSHIHKYIYYSYGQQRDNAFVTCLLCSVISRNETGIFLALYLFLSLIYAYKFIKFSILSLLSD